MTIKYLKSVGFEKSYETKKKKEEESKSSLGTFQSPITSVKIGILASGFFLRGLLRELNKHAKLQLAEWTINTFKKCAKIGSSVAGYICTRPRSPKFFFRGAAIAVAIA